MGGSQANTYRFFIREPVKAEPLQIAFYFPRYYCAELSAPEGYLSTRLRTIQFTHQSTKGVEFNKIIHLRWSWFLFRFFFRIFYFPLSIVVLSLYTNDVRIILMSLNESFMFYDKPSIVYQITTRKIAIVFSDWLFALFATLYSGNCRVLFCSFVCN